MRDDKDLGMYKSPVIIGIKQSNNWNDSGSVEATLYDLGRNTGNMMFTQALLSVLKDATWGSFGLGAAELEGRDSIVVACANWINAFEDFGWLADRIEKTNLPIVLIGIGAQSSLSMEVPSVAPGTKRLLSLAADRSSSISARGVFTCEVLNSLGFKNVMPTGCPSLLLSGRQGPMISMHSSVTSDTSCLHATRHGTQVPHALDAALYRFAFRNKMDIILQSEAPDIYYSVLNNGAAKFGDEQISSTLIETYDGGSIGAVVAYLREHGRAFTNFSDWITFMGTKSFCFGTRVHGTIASLIAGTPATLIAHDSRTLEMAETMGLPYMLSKQFSDANFRDLNSIVQRAGIEKLIGHYPTYLSNFERFFLDNRLPLLGNF